MDEKSPYQKFFDAAPCYLTVQGPDLKVIAANKRFESDFGDYRGKYCYQVYKRRPEPCEVCSVAKTFHDGRSYSSVEQVRTVDGREKSVLINTEPVFDDSGAIVSVVEQSTDITELKRLQDQLRISQEKYRTLFEEVPCYISVQDRDLRLVEANRMLRNDFGASYGDRCYEVYRHRTEPCAPCIVQETFDRGEVIVHEEVIFKHDGQPVNVLVHTAPIRNASGEIGGVMEMSADITRLRQLQSQLESLGLLIGSISHGVKGLLNGLDGGVYLVNGGLKQKDDAKVRKGWEIVQRNIGRIRSMILDVLYYARDRELTLESFDPKGLLQEVVETLAEKAATHSVTLDSAAGDSDLMMTADRKALRSLLINLLENSIDACRVDRKKTEHRVLCSLRGGEGTITFEISDDGIGMDRETREKAFTLFFSSKGSEGTGLGLFIADKIAKAHKGSIKVESELDKGTTFRVAIPVALK